MYIRYQLMKIVDSRRQYITDTCQIHGQWNNPLTHERVKEQVYKNHNAAEWLLIGYCKAKDKHIIPLPGCKHKISSV